MILTETNKGMLHIQELFFRMDGLKWDGQREKYHISDISRGHNNMGSLLGYCVN